MNVTAEDILARLDIISVVSEYIQLKKAGQNYIGLCPFHHEKTPSFSVNEKKQLWHCFGCQAGGNLFTFIMKIENKSYEESFKILAQKAGITLTPKENKEEEELLKINQITARFFNYVLINSPAGKKAMAYLNNRKITDETIKKYKLGYAPSNSNELTRFLETRGYSLKSAVTAGVLRRGKTGRFYSYFRGRIIFPIFDLAGRVIAFGGRLLENEEGPKYLNTGDTILFSKSKNLYLLNFAKEEISKSGEVVIVEGYFDALTPHQHGKTNLVATLGTSITTAQLRLLEKVGQRIIFCFDSDSAGIKATLRAEAMLEDLGLEGKIITLPANLDPDRFVREQGINEFQRYIAKATDFFYYYFDHHVSRFDLAKADQRASFINDKILPFLKKVKNSLKRYEYVQATAERTMLTVELILQLLQDPKAPNPLTVKDTISASSPAKESQIYEDIIRFLLKDKNFRDKFFQFFSESVFQNEKHRSIIRTLKESAKNKEEINEVTIMSKLDDQLQNQLTLILMKEETFPYNPDELFNYVKDRFLLAYFRQLEKEVKILLDKGDLDKNNEKIIKYQQLLKYFVSNPANLRPIDFWR